MKICVMQPYFLPYLGYWQLLNYVDKFIIFDDVNYIKKGYINRNKMLLKNGLYQFTLSIDGASQNKKICELKLLGDHEKILKTISQGYKDALNFETIYPFMEDIFSFRSPCLVDFIEHSIKKICDLLSIKVEILKSSKIILNESGANKIIPLCKLHSANVYVNPVGGMELYKKDDFLAHNIDLRFIKLIPLEYDQLNTPFHPNLSIVDFLFNVPKANWGRHLEGYEII
ncbi:WbqC family protein [Polynucleobacter paneuropaeus]|uniref:WbqC family protein n=2 Tax=Polynucleobacter paneuropaeus TaxID=2527775 RepID=A0A2Z4JRA1_9BURK|nr:WbqC family protein [Polynucleobacter paneuropaeus]AWW49189.1 hypothetical protein Pas1_01645 [Polynucleobacter paneuropaeus]